MEGQRPDDYVQTWEVCSLVLQLSSSRRSRGSGRSATAADSVAPLVHSIHPCLPLNRRISREWYRLLASTGGELHCDGAVPELLADVCCTSGYPPHLPPC